MSVDDADVLVIGAGRAAARELQRVGAEVRVLEARDRVGGRTWSAKVGDTTFDYGGQWIGPTQTRMRALCDALGGATLPTFHEGTKVLFSRGRRSTYKSSIPSLSLLNVLHLGARWPRSSANVSAYRSTLPGPPHAPACWTA